MHLKSDGKMSDEIYQPENNETKPLGARTLLKKPDFAKLFGGALTSEVGSSFAFIAIIFLAIDITRDLSFAETAQAVALVTLVQVIPTLAVGPFAGVLVDRFDRKRIMVLGDLIGAFTAFSFLFATEMYMIYILAGISATARLFFYPARSASIPKIASKENLVPANGLLQTVTQLSTLIGPALAGIIIGLTSLQTAFLIDGVSYALSALLIYRIRQDLRPPQTEQQVTVVRTLKDLGEGFGIVIGDRVVSFLLITFTVVMLGISMINPVFAIYLVDTFGLAEQDFGLIVSFSAISGLITAIIVTSRGKIERKLTFIILGGIFTAGLGVLVLGLAPSLPYQIAWLYVGMAIIGIVNVSVGIPLSALIQAIIKNEHLGKVNGIMGTILAFANVGGAATASYLVTFVPISQLFIYLGIAIGSMALIAYSLQVLTGLEKVAIRRELEATMQLENAEMYPEVMKSDQSGIPAGE